MSDDNNAQPAAAEPRGFVPSWIMQTIVSLNTVIWLAAIPWAMTINSAIVRIETKMEALTNGKLEQRIIKIEAELEALRRVRKP